MSARGTHRQELPQPTRGRSGTSSLDESRPVGWAPHERRHLLGLQEGRTHLSAMLERASRTNTKIHSKKKDERHVCVGEKKVAILDLARLQVLNNGPHLPSTNTRCCKGDKLNARKWIWNMEWMIDASYMSFIERVNNESTRYMY